MFESDVNPEQLLEILSEPTKDPTTPERLEALLTFSAWMHWPKDQEILRHARIVAAANVFVSNGPQNLSGPSQAAMAAALVNFPLTARYDVAYESFDMGEIADLVAFFMHCPLEEKPSFLKACFFIDEGGLVADDVPINEYKFNKRSPATSKIAWRAQLPAGPCILADAYIDEETQNIYNFAPDGYETVATAKAYLKNAELVAHYLGVARFCQERLVSRLDPVSLERVSFPTFPSRIKPVDPGLGTFDEKQLAILRRYRAPRSIDKGISLD